MLASVYWNICKAMHSVKPRAAIQVSGFKPVTTVTPTKGLGGATSLHWQSRTREYANEHRAQQFVALFQAVVRPTGDAAGGAGAQAGAQKGRP